ncbi:MAG: DinB family protein, partial [Armatimonadetes bacterium]|nr:DinB family protein [Armatimonadota bacterium]
YTRHQLDSFFEAVHAVPADKLDWKPTPKSRSALDQLQEVAAVFKSVPETVKNRRLDFTAEQFEEYEVDRKKITDPAELERITREGTEELLKFVRSVDPSELTDKVEMPWPGEFKVADVLSYHYWNMAYHEGQIYYISTLIDGKTLAR